MNLVIFGLKAHIHWTSCECKYSYSFTWIFLKKTTTLQLFLSRSEDVHVIGYDMDFFWKYNINFFPNDGCHGLVGQE